MSIATLSTPPEFARNGDGTLIMSTTNQDLGKRAVTVTRCFPWSDPMSWLSIRDAKGAEIALLESVDILCEESRKALVNALAEVAFVFVVTAIVEVAEQFELRQWRVRLRQGERSFQTKLNAWPRALPSGELLIQDVANDFYLVENIDALDSKSAQLLSAFIDD